VLPPGRASINDLGRAGAGVVRHLRGLVNRSAILQEAVTPMSEMCDCRSTHKIDGAGAINLDAAIRT